MLLNREKIALAYRVGFGEWKSLLPLLMLFMVLAFVGWFIAFVAAFLIAMIADPDIAKNFAHAGAPGGPNPFSGIGFGAAFLAVSAGLIALFAILALYISAVISLLYARSHQLAISAGYFTSRMARSFWPVMGVWWAISWRAFVMGMIGSVIVIAAVALTHHGELPKGTDGSEGSLAMILGMLLVWFGIVAYLMPFNFTMVERILHPQVRFAESLRRMRRQVRGRRWEVVIAMFVCYLPQLPYYFVRGALGDQHPLLFLFLGLPLTTFLSLPFLLINYLFYEEFEQNEGLAPMIEAQTEAHGA